MSGRITGSQVMSIVAATDLMFNSGSRRENYSRNVKQRGWNKCPGYEAFCKKQKYDMAALADLSVDYSYQRSCINRAVVEDICENFDVRLMRPLKVSVHSMCILDGQHTAMACVRRGMKEVPIVLLDSSSKEDAYLFVQFNKKHNKVSPADIFKARVTEGDPVAKALDKVLGELDMIPVKGSTHAGHGIQGISTVMDMAEQNMERAVMGLRCADKLCPGQVMSMSVLRGMWWLDEHGIDMSQHIDRLCDILDKSRKALSRQDAVIYAVNLKEFGMSIRTTDKTSFSIGELYGTVILEILNKGKRTKRLVLGGDSK